MNESLSTVWTAETIKGQCFGETIVSLDENNLLLFQ